MQFYIITIIFSSVSPFLSGSELSMKYSFRLFLMLTFALSLFLHLNSLAKSTGGAYFAAKSNLVKITKKLYTTNDPKERKYLEFIKSRIELVRPMSACGYFEIDKSTMTSMVSVRYGNLQLHILNILLVVLPT